MRNEICLGSAVLLAACGGGGGSAPTSPAAVEVAQPTRTRASEGFDVQVTPYRMSDAASSAPTRVEIRVTDAGQVASLVASVGKEFDGATALAVLPAGAGVWSLAWPAGVAADSGLLLTFTLKNEDVFETGLADFQLNR